MNRGGAEREGDTESEAGSRLRAISTEPDAALKLKDCEIMTWAEVGRLTNQATQAPLKIYFSNIVFDPIIWFNQDSPTMVGDKELIIFEMLVVVHR